MRFNLIRVFIFFAFVLLALSAISQNKVIEIASPWQFKQIDKTEWYPAKVPGNVFIDLLGAGLIKDPYYADQVNESRWVEKKNWEYKTSFECDQSLLRNDHIDLIFDGLDTHASVFLNDSMVLKANNMFRSWTIDVKKQLRLGKNNLRVLFESAVLHGQNEAAKLPYVLPEEERIFSRKAQFQFGWDFAPRFVGCGIWKPVKLNVWNDLKINSVQHQVVSLNDSVAKLHFIIESFCQRMGEYELKISTNTSSNTSQEKIEESISKKLKSGINSDTLTLSILHPKLWWCNGMGEPFLYDFLISVKNKKQSIQSMPLAVGIRSLELVKEMDENGISFNFVLNSVPVFMKGANYVPDDVFLRPKSKADHEKVITSAVESHMNMLRIWGGGVYPDDEFFNACDKAGILVWQDLMFACAMYPSDSAFILNVKEEIKQQLIRLRNHPSLAIWCGNNEIDEAWHNWGWQKQFKYSSQDSTTIWKGYEHLFLKTTSGLLQKYDLSRTYWPSSPSVGWGHKESLTQGDSHYWGVWWGMEPFEMYQKKSGRFMSEYGFQSMPSVSTFKKVCPDTALSLNSSCLKLHQKHPKGYQTIQTYLERSYNTPKSFESYVYVSQLLQRDGMQMAIETHRRNKPVCMGTLFWQMNDCWPITSWSAIDYFKQPKAFYYALKNLYKTQALSVTDDETEIRIYLISDSIANSAARINVKLLSLNSEVLWQKTYPGILTNNKDSKIRIPKSELLMFDSLKTFLKLELFSLGKTLALKHYFFSNIKNISLPKAEIQVTRIDSTTLELSSNVFAKDVYVYDEKEALLFNDNFFNLELGQKKRIHLLTPNKELNTATLKIQVLNNL